MFCCHSYYSLRFGTLSPEDLVVEAKKYGIKTLILADILNTSAYFDFCRSCLKNGIKPLAGLEFRSRDQEFLYITIACNNQGVYEINHFFTDHSLHNIPFPEVAPAFKNCIVLYRFNTPFRILKENEFIGIAPFETGRLFSSPWKEKRDKLVAFCPVTFKTDEGYKYHRILRAIDQNRLLSQLDSTNIAHPGEHFYTLQELERFYASYPELLENAERLIENAVLEPEPEGVKNKKNFSGSKEEDYSLLYRLANEGFSKRYADGDHKARERLEKELKVIYEQNFLCYFLITWDILQFAASSGYHHVGRGSGANSIVSYCLQITDVNPMELDLYFERFINPSRTSPPDFDIDFCWNERDDVFRYIFERYTDSETGEHHVGLLATYATFQHNSLVREIGKVYGLPRADIELIAEEKNPDPRHHYLRNEILALTEKLKDFPNHLSIHAGGVIITEKPVNYYTALEMMPKGFPIVQFDMHVAEENGFHKYDILSQRGLGHIKDTVQLVRQNQGKEVDIHRVNDFFEDKNIREQLRSARTIGCFYIESPAMRGLLSKLRCDDYRTLVAASSIIRPGVAKSGMMRQYIERFHNRDFEYLDPVFAELLGETFGIMVYQEDVIKIAHHFGGLELNEADILRRTMSGKNRNKELLEEARKKFFENCRRKGHSENLITEVWRQIDSFSGYSFCKAHSASYAVESYQSLFLKTYFPLEFMVGVLNNFGGFYRTEVYVHEARMSGAKIEAPCVNNSEYLSTISGNIIYLGFILLKNLEQDTACNIIRERKLNGNYQNLEDLIRRTGISKEQINILVRIGALRFTGKTRQELLWGKNQFITRIKPSVATNYIFPADTEEKSLPELETEEMEEVYEQIELLGFPLVSPFDILQTRFRGEIQTRDMLKYLGNKVRMVGYYVAKKDTRTSKGQIMNFGTWIDYEGNFFDTTHFPPSLARYPFTGLGCYLLLGKVVEDFGFPSLEVEKMARLPWKEIRP